MPKGVPENFNENLHYKKCINCEFCKTFKVVKGNLKVCSEKREAIKNPNPFTDCSMFKKKKGSPSQWLTG